MLGGHVWFGTRPEEASAVVATIRQQGYMPNVYTQQSRLAPFTVEIEVPRIKGPMEAKDLIDAVKASARYVPGRFFRKEAEEHEKDPRWPATWSVDPRHWSLGSFDITTSKAVSAVVVLVIAGLVAWGTLKK